MSDSKKETKNNFVGYAEMPQVTMKLRLTVAELDQLKAFATDKGNVFLTIKVTKDKEKDNKGNAWCVVYDPSQAGIPPSAPTNADGAELPF
jgi:hypothetical protein